MDMTFVCSFCTNPFPTMGARNRHEKICAVAAEMGRFGWFCSFCDDEFGTAHHRQSHEADCGRLRCSNCPKYFSSRKVLAFHEWFCRDYTDEKVDIPTRLTTRVDDTLCRTPSGKYAGPILPPPLKAAPQSFWNDGREVCTHIYLHTTHSDGGALFGLCNPQFAWVCQNCDYDRNYIDHHHKCWICHEHRQ